MNYENIDNAIKSFYDSLPYGKYFSDSVHQLKIDYKEQLEIKKFLIDNSIIETWNNGDKYIITKKGEDIINIHSGITNYLNHVEKQLNEQTRLEKIKNQKLYFDAKLSKWKYYTFWPFFVLAVFGGGYSTYDFIERLSKPKANQSVQSPTAEMELEESKSHTLILNQKNLDSLRSSKTLADSVTIN